MNDDNGGTFKKSLLSFELLQKTLFEEVGGDHAVSMLDSLSKLNRSEQELILKVVSSVINRIEGGEFRLTTDSDLEAKRFEDSLYNEIMRDMREAALIPKKLPKIAKKRKLEVVRGGQSPVEKPKQPINLSDVRKSRTDRDKIIH